MFNCQNCPDSSKQTIPLYDLFFLPSCGRGILMRLRFQNEMDSLARAGMPADECFAGSTGTTCHLLRPRAEAADTVGERETIIREM